MVIEVEITLKVDRIVLRAMSFICLAVTSVLIAVISTVNYNSNYKTIQTAVTE